MVEEQEDVEFMSPHKHIKTTTTNGTFLTEHLLNTSRRPWTLERTERSPCYQVG